MRRPFFSPDTPIRSGGDILANHEPTLRNWENFAKTILTDMEIGRAELRDHADQMLRAVAADLKTAQAARGQALES